MVVFDEVKNELVYKSVEAPDQVMGSNMNGAELGDKTMTGNGQELAMGHNYTRMEMVYCVDDGSMSPMALSLFNMDDDPNGEEIEGSPDEAREQAHVATVLNAIHHFLAAGEAEQITYAHE